MKVLILTCNNGGGHNVIAEALRQCYANHGDDCEVRDCFSFFSPAVSDCVSFAHNFVFCYLPGFYGSSLRRAEENPDLFSERRLARKLINLGRFSLGKYIRSQGIDQVLCTHVFAAMMLTAAKKKYSLAVRTALVETDHGNTPGCTNNDMDFHFLPDKSLVPGLLSAGIEKSKLVVTGIPVREEIKQRTGNGSAKKALELDPDKPHLLMMGGSMGGGPLRELFGRLYRSQGGKVQLTVLCGSNTRLQKELTAKFGHFPTVRILGFAPDLSLLYDSADLLLTKPGGSTTAEAAVKQLPMVLINLVAGPESHNLDFFLKNGGAVTGGTTEELCARCEMLLRDGERRQKMCLALQRISSADATEIIYRTMTH